MLKRLFPKMASRTLLRATSRWVSSAIPSTASSGAIGSRFTQTPKGPEDAILGVTLAYNANQNPNKVNLGVGAYRDDDGKPFVLSAVREAEKRLLSRGLAMEYLPVIGHSSFIEKAVRLAYGENGYIRNGCVASIQTLSGTGACRMAGAFMSRFLDVSTETRGEKPLVLLPNPTWTNHTAIFTDAGCNITSYDYYDPVTKSLAYDACLKSLSDAPDASVVLLHACAHNPTGVDPSPEQWSEISAVLKAKRHLPLFDMAYQGFTSGDADADASSVRQFVEDGHRVVLAQSFSKNFGLYGHRVGCLSILTDTPKEKEAINSQLKILARPMYSNPPLTGVRIVDEILGNHELEQSWRTEMRAMAKRIISMRILLKEALIKLGSSHNWDHIVDQNGMFCYSGLTKEQVDELREKHSVYLTSNGRISMAGVTSKNVEYLANAIHEVTK